MLTGLRASVWSWLVSSQRMVLSNMRVKSQSRLRSWTRAGAFFKLVIMVETRCRVDSNSCTAANAVLGSAMAMTHVRHSGEPGKSCGTRMPPDRYSRVFTMWMQAVPLLHHRKTMRLKDRLEGRPNVFGHLCATRTCMMPEHTGASTSPVLPAGCSAAVFQLPAARAATASYFACVPPNIHQAPGFSNDVSAWCMSAMLAAPTPDLRR